MMSRDVILPFSNVSFHPGKVRVSFASSLSILSQPLQRGVIKPPNRLLNGQMMALSKQLYMIHTNGDSLSLLDAMFQHSRIKQCLLGKPEVQIYREPSPTLCRENPKETHIHSIFEVECLQSLGSSKTSLNNVVYILAFLITTSTISFLYA